MPGTPQAGAGAGLLEGKRAIVTGAASGIGRASAELFATEGALVLAADLSENVHQVAKEIEASGGRAIAEVADVSDSEAVAGLVERAVGELGGLEVVYANAGIAGLGLRQFPDIALEDFRRLLDINLVGTFDTVQRAAAVMIPNGTGSIILTSSVAGLRAHAGGIAYSASKAGVISLAQTIASELRGTGVRINAICPGLIETGMTKPVFDWARARGSADRIGNVNPMQRHGHAREIAEMALFLASDRASYVNGQAIAVDGGLSAGHPYAGGRARRASAASSGD